MTQDVVTARDATALAAGTLQFEDAQLICQKVNLALKEEGYPPPGYSEPVLKLFQLGWAVAALKHNTQVTVFHLAYALVCVDQNAGKALAEYLKTDVDSLAVGCILGIMTLGVSGPDAGIVLPSVDATRWLGEASQHVRQSELHPVELVRAIPEDALRSARASLRKAARWGSKRGDGGLLGARSLPAPSSPRDVIQHIEQVERGEPRIPPDLAGMISLLEDFEQRTSEDLENQKLALSRIEAALPRPPPGTRVAAAVIVVLTLGVAVGLALAVLEQSSRLTQALSASGN